MEIGLEKWKYLEMTRGCNQMLHPLVDCWFPPGGGKGKSFFTPR